MKRFDLIVIGAGSGGVRTARLAAGRGWNVAIVEERFAGGTCVNVGCVPKKLMSYAAGFPHQFDLAADFGWSLHNTKPALSWQTLKANRDQEIDRLQAVYQRLLHDSGVTWLEGHAHLLSADTVQVGDQRIQAEHILIATGSSPLLPDIPGQEHLSISDALFALPELPKRAVVWGGGYIASEFASILNGLGSAVTLVHRGPYVLNRFDGECAQFLHQALERQGITMRMNDHVESVAKTGNALSITLASGDSIEADVAFCAIGRKPNTANLGLETLGIKTNQRGDIITDKQHQSSVGSIYALGDVTGGAQLTPVALREAMNLIDHWFNDGKNTLPLNLIPNAVFTHPCYASVGMSEEAAREEGVDIAIYRTSFRPMDHTMGSQADRVLMKLIIDATTDRVLGAHMIGEGAAEIIQGLAVAMTAGATKSSFDATLGIHPTAAEEWVTLRTPS